MKVTFLGTGASQGIPVIGLDHPVCKSIDPKDRRLRSSILVESQASAFLVDCGPDLRAQLLSAECKKLTAVFLTHEHADHTAGFDELRSITNVDKKWIPLYAHPRTLSNLKSRFSYAFGENRYDTAPRVTPIELSQENIAIEDLKIIPILVNHGDIDIYGYRFNDFVYITDAKYINRNQFHKLKGIDTLVVNAMQMESHKTHFNLEDALRFVDEIKPRKTYLTHISHKLGTDKEVSKILPDNVALAYDGLKIDLGCRETAC